MGYRDKGPRLKDRLRPILHADTDNAWAQRFTLMLQPVDADAYKHNEFEEDYKYEYEPIMQLGDDPVWYAIRDVIKKTMSNGLIFANAGVHVYDATTAPPIWPPSKDDPEHCVKFYTFTQESLEFPMTVPVTVIPRFGTLTGDMLHVKLSQKWVPLKEWLLTIPHEDVGKNRTQLQMLQTFWRRNGKTFRFLDLPAKLRQLVYEHALGKQVYPLAKILGTRVGAITVRKVGNVVLGTGYTRNNSYDDVPEDRAPVWPPNLALLRVCQQIHNEALKTEWESALKCFNELHNFSLVVANNVGPLRQFNCLAKLQLNLSLRDWFRLFGVDVEGDLPIVLDESASKGVLLTKDRLPKLAYLEMRFRDPQYGRKGNPWSDSDCCQIDMVDMVCTFAFPFVSRIPTVEIEGFVKTASKNKWERIYDHERHGLQHEHDQQVSMEAILHAPADLLPPSCSCQNPCTSTHKSRWRERSRWNKLCPDGYTVTEFQKGSSFELDDDIETRPS